MVPPSACFPTRRAALAEEAARRALAGLGPELVLPQLRAQTVQELLAQPGGAGCELCGTLQTLTGALTQCVRRRPGWLYVMFPSGITCPVPARPALVQAAVLEALRPVLACGGQAVLEVKPRSRAVLLCLRGGAPAGVLPLWQALARQSGGAVVFDSGAQFAAAAFLPLCPGCRIQKSPSTQELLEDRFSLPYLFLSGYRGKHGRQPAQANAAHGQAGQQGLFRDAAAHQLKDGLRQFVAGCKVKCQAAVLLHRAAIGTAGNIQQLAQHPHTKQRAQRPQHPAGRAGQIRHKDGSHEIRSTRWRTRSSG